MSFLRRAKIVFPCRIKSASPINGVSRGNSVPRSITLDVWRITLPTTLGPPSVLASQAPRSIE